MFEETLPMGILDTLGKYLSTFIELIPIDEDLSSPIGP